MAHISHIVRDLTRREALVGLGALGAASVADANLLLGGSNAALPQSGQLAAGHWVPAKMTLSSARVVLPRPDTETSSFAYSRNAHPNIQYVQPVRAQGGAYPHYFALTSGPAGASIGQFYNSANYGVVTWTPTSGTQTFSVLITDQDGVQVTVTWTVTVGTTWALFSDTVNGNDSTGTGTFSNPYKTLTKAISVASGGKCICLRAGTYSAPTTTSTMGSSTYSGMFGYPGESVTIDCSTSTANEGCWSENGSDLYVAGIFFSSGPSAQQNPRCFTNQNAGNRLYKYNCSFDNPPAGTAGSGVWDNQACWFLGDPGSQRSYIGLLNCAFSRLPPSGNGYMVIDTYNCKYMVWEGNTFGAPNASTGEQFAMFVKGGGNQEISVRRNTFSQGWATTNLCFYFGDDGTGTNSTDQEMCYNTFVGTVSTGWNSIINQINNGQNNSQPVTAWSYRNTIVGTPTVSYQSVNVLTFTSQNDAIVTNSTASGATGKWLAVNFGDAQDAFRNPTTIPSVSYSISGTECQGSTSAGILDGGFLLTGSFRATYLGTRGAEIA